MFRLVSLLLTLMLTTVSCYRMPTDEDYSVVPVTNHPDVTGDTNATPGMPTLNYQKDHAAHNL